MSVPVPMRSHGKLEINIMALDLCNYTIDITDNENVFNRMHTHLIEQLQDTAISIHLDCLEANDIKVDNDWDRYNRRMDLQVNAIYNCTKMCSLIEIAKRVFHLSTKRAIFWTGKVIALRDKINNWHNSNKNNLKPENRLYLS